MLVIVDVNPRERFEIPTEAYLSVEQPRGAGAESAGRTFAHLRSEVGAYEAEEVGVEHLLRDIRGATESTVADRASARLAALHGLKRRLEDVAVYLSRVADGTLPANQDVLKDVQDMFNLLPQLQQERMAQAFAVKTNDSLLAVYLASLVRGILALHNLINNKTANRALEREAEDRESGAAERRAAEQKAKEEKERAEKEAAEKEKEQKAGARGKKKHDASSKSK